MTVVITAVAIQIIIVAISYLAGRYIFPKIPEGALETLSSSLSIMSQYADRYVAWAKQFMPDATGSEKMNTVVGYLQNIANKYHIDMNVTDIQAIAQAAYNAMKKGMADSQAVEAQIVHEDVAKPAPATLPEVKEESTPFDNFSIDEIKQKMMETAEPAIISKLLLALNKITNKG